ncbi:hypothetical protein N7456_007225 [Penicillium angulare]|uniref:C2H2-type domain-containing protein n=1 Tax=Penicillium angulare TaxID=116970 RepID=A0A9W9KCV0_9EURO|nr:hypothetical protein N7456_007225 [Penicillium angulare]
MGTTLDGLSSQPLVNRRPAAPTLPSFELPPPQFGLPGGVTSKFAAQQNHQQTAQSAANVAVGHLLTPPATNQSGETATAHHTSEIAPSYWSGTSPYGTAAPGSATQNWASGVNPGYQQRPAYSPGSIGRGGVTSPPTTDGHPQPYEAPSLASFQQGLPAPPSSLPPNASHPATMALYPSGHGTSPAPLPSNDPYAHKHPSLYGTPHQLNTPHQTGFSPIYGAHSLASAGYGMNHQGRMPPQSPSGQPHLSYPRQPWPSYSLPAMNGPVMTNVHSPNSPMAMMGGMQPGILPGFNSGHVANTQHLFGGHMPPHGMPAPAPDRPFKCDQCPQSFNRNHDLKRHKRIHLAVKPFPCAHCDKSFSRKDALKRHILVKGCGKDGDSDGTSTQPNDAIKGEVRSEDGSPLLNGHT